VSRLCERDDFPELIQATANGTGIDPAIVEKDYYVTEALRIIAKCFGDLVLFKGGTSLSKGWKLIERFSEDIDLYVQPDDSSSRATARRLKEIANTVAQHPALRADETRKKSVPGGRTEYFSYEARAGAVPGIDAVVMLEAGIQSGDYPWRFSCRRECRGGGDSPRLAPPPAGSLWRCCTPRRRGTD